MIDLASIRNASFTLTPTGYNPEEVDRFLADLADQLAEGLSAPAAAEYEQASEYEPNPQFDVVPEPEPQPAYEISVPAEREPADVDGLRAVIERTIGAMDSFVANELETLKSATELETEELLRERERMLDEAGEAAKAHLEETRARAESILAEARRDGEAMRARFEGELQADRERFEQALADRDAQAQAQVAEVLADAERRRREADELISSANRVQTEVLASLEHAKASLAPQAPAAPVVVEQPAYDEDIYPVEPTGAYGDAFSPDAPEEHRYDSTNDAAA
jgi:DivIVA domain-containing protein